MFHKVNFLRVLTVKCMQKIKFYNYFLCLVLIVTIAVTIFVFTRKNTSFTQSTPQEVFNQKNSNYRLQIKGFEFDSFVEGKNVISIKADKFTIEKKKLGFFRLGLINDAIFKNAIIDVYLKRKASGIDTDFINESLPSLKDALPSFTKKRISSIIIEPACLNLMDKKSLVTRITSKSAFIRRTKHNILFKGGVQVVSADKRLMSERLILSSENSVMKIDSHFILKTPEKKIEGDYITLDIYLNAVNDKIVRKLDDSRRSTS